MKMKLLSNRLLLLLFGLFILLSLDAQAQIKFVQISDPHMFDEETEALDNKAAFTACLRQINDEVANGTDYKFIVLTGDIGVENLVSIFSEKDGKRERLFEVDKKKRDEKIKAGAAELAAIMAPSKVKVWLFVPGNNDLFNEEITTLDLYQQFIDELAKQVAPWGITVKNLCRAGQKPPQVGNAQPTYYLDGAYAFIGFNDASFKNNNEPRRVASEIKASVPPTPGIVSLNAAQIEAKQKEYVQQVLNDVGSGGAYAYVFYHIPEIDDPYLISGGSEQKLLDSLLVREQSLGYIGRANKYSAWFVASSVRDRWAEVVKNDKVRGLFAGHFHSKDRDIYQSYHWMRSAEYLSGSLSKLHICPPLAVKLQVGEKTPARGFQEVSIDKEGRVLTEDGQPGVRILWYDPTTGTFSASTVKKADEEARRQIQLGSYLESSGRLKEAEAAYTKALEAESPQLRQEAVTPLRRVVDKQVSPLNRYIFTPLGFSLSPEGTYLFLALCALLLLLAIFCVLGYYLSDRSNAERRSLFRQLAILVLLPVLLLAIMIALKKDFSLSASTAIVLTVLVLLVCLYVLWLVFQRARLLTMQRGKNKLIIVSLADTTNGKLASVMPSVFAVEREKIIKSKQFEEMVSSKPTLPVVILAEDTEVAELVETTVPGRWGNLLGWLLRRTSEPAFSLRTALQSAGGNTTLIMSLEAVGHTERIWSGTFADADLHTKQQDLAYQVLIHILRRINYGEDYDDAP